MFMTLEQRALFEEFAASHPEIVFQHEYLAAGICEVNGKRALCLRLKGHVSGEPVYLHYAPDGLSEEEMTTITRQHGMRGFTASEGDGTWETVLLGDAA